MARNFERRGAGRFSRAGRDPMGFRGVVRRKPISHPDSIGAVFAGALFVVIAAALASAVWSPLALPAIVIAFAIVARHFTQGGRR